MLSPCISVNSEFFREVYPQDLHLCMYYFPVSCFYVTVSVSSVFSMYHVIFLPIPMASPSKAWNFGQALAGIVGSNPTGGMDICLL
jgi:hypothetical protein